MYRIFSVDDHVIEPPTVWTSRVPAKYRDVAPHVVEEDGLQYWAYEDQRILTVGLNAVAGKPREDWSADPTRFDSMIPGCFDPAERALDLLANGVLASINFPTLPRFGGLLFPSFQDKELASHCVRAWNDFILEEWCPGGPPGLFVPMTICQLWDPEAAAKEIARCVELGSRSLCIVENPAPSGLPSFHDERYWDPIWSVCQEADIPLSMHIASSGSLPRPDERMPDVGLVAISDAQSILSMTNIMFSPMLKKFPDLKIVWSEAGIGWVPELLDRVDRAIERHGGWSHYDGDLKASEVFARNMWCCMLEEPRALSHWDEIGKDKILVETDYPHSDGTYPQAQEVVASVVQGIPDDVVEAITHENAERLFKWTMADAALTRRPDVVAWRDELAKDPYAALARRRPVEGVVHVERVDDGTCRQMTRDYGKQMLVPCGLPVGPDGVCAAGHALVAS
jgi:predicted TIM-barrel fold metal-dependent hydrolase